jgi:predicted CxxxxCH...CXXCH cytochrome family protein
MCKILVTLGAAALLLAPAAGQALDPREQVPLAPQMQESVLNRMRDHLVALDTIISHVAYERYGEAAKLAERRFTMNPFDPAEDARINAALPEPMQAANAALFEAGTRLAAAARKADTDRSYAAIRAVNWALSDITAACNGCHAHYRVR